MFGKTHNRADPWVTCCSHTYRTCDFQIPILTPVYLISSNKSDIHVLQPLNSVVQIRDWSITTTPPSDCLAFVNTKLQSTWSRRSWPQAVGWSVQPFSTEIWSKIQGYGYVSDRSPQYCVVTRIFLWGSGDSWKDAFERVCDDYTDTFEIFHERFRAYLWIRVFSGEWIGYFMCTLYMSRNMNFLIGLKKPCISIPSDVLRILHTVFLPVSGFLVFTGY
jgi:hypothetical protein